MHAVERDDGHDVGGIAVYGVGCECGVPCLHAECEHTRAELAYGPVPPVMLGECEDHQTQSCDNERGDEEPETHLGGSGAPRGGKARDEAVGECTGAGEFGENCADDHAEEEEALGLGGPGWIGGGEHCYYAHYPLAVNKL